MNTKLTETSELTERRVDGEGRGVLIQISVRCDSDGIRASWPAHAGHPEPANSRSRHQAGLSAAPIGRDMALSLQSARRSDKRRLGRRHSATRNNQYSR